jgi:hypothetical protein
MVSCIPQTLCALKLRTKSRLWGKTVRKHPHSVCIGVCRSLRLCNCVPGGVIVGGPAWPLLVLSEGGFQCRLGTWHVTHAVIGNTRTLTCVPYLAAHSGTTDVSNLNYRVIINNVRDCIHLLLRK